MWEGIGYADNEVPQCSPNIADANMWRIISQIAIAPRQ